MNETETHADVEFHDLAENDENTPKNKKIIIEYFVRWAVTSIVEQQQKNMRWKEEKEKINNTNSKRSLIEAKEEEEEVVKTKTHTNQQRTHRQQHK